MIKLLPNGIVAALLEGLRVSLQTRFDADELDVVWLTDNPTIIEPGDNKGIGIVLINEYPNNSIHIEQNYWRKRTFEVGIELRASIHNDKSPYYVAHNLMEYLRRFLEVELREEGLSVNYQKYDYHSQTYIPRTVGRAFSYFDSTRTPSVRLEQRQSNFCLAQCTYHFKWTNED
jgi:hypothetical protein